MANEKDLKKGICIVTESNIMSALAAALVGNEMTHHTPRNIEIILRKFSDKFRSLKMTDHLGNMYYVNMSTRKEMEELLNGILFNIPEFVELNLNKREYAAGKRAFDVFPPKPEPEEKPEMHISFTNRYHEFLEEEEFLDLDAAINMTLNYLEAIMIWGDDECLPRENFNGPAVYKLAQFKLTEDLTEHLLKHAKAYREEQNKMKENIKDNLQVSKSPIIGIGITPCDIVDIIYVSMGVPTDEALSKTEQNIKQSPDKKGTMTISISEIWSALNYSLGRHIRDAFSDPKREMQQDRRRIQKRYGKYMFSLYEELEEIWGEEVHLDREDWNSLSKNVTGLIYTLDTINQMDNFSIKLNNGDNTIHPFAIDQTSLIRDLFHTLMVMKIDDLKQMDEFFKENNK